MFKLRFKTGLFMLEGANALATTCYFYYAYFLMEEWFGFVALQNLALAAVIGLTYTFAAFFGGRFAQRWGGMLSLRLGFSTMATALLVGSQLQSLAAQLTVIMVANVGMCFTWPALQALVSEGEKGGGLQRVVGIYNVTWAGGSAIAYFGGGALVERFGANSILLVPGLIHLAQLAFTFVLAKCSKVHEIAVAEEKSLEPTIQRRPGFLQMAWLANPFAYLAINTVVPVIPTVAKQLNLSPKFAGFFCSVWFFVRAASFVLLRIWPKWHYHFGWLAAAYAGLIASFTAILAVKSLWVLIVAQVIFGLSLGLIYYSSLYYSMDGSAEKGEQGGIHEAAIGAGCFAGPAIGAGALYFFPNQPNSSVWAVSALLCLGFIPLLWLRFRRSAVARGSVEDVKRGTVSR